MYAKQSKQPTLSPVWSDTIRPVVSEGCDDFFPRSKKTWFSCQNLTYGHQFLHVMIPNSDVV